MFMTRKSIALVALTLLLPFQVLAQDVVVTRFFTGLWDQTQHENQGLNLQIVDQANGQTAGVAYWYTYGDDRKSAWYIGIGPVNGNRVEMTLYEVDDVGFLQNDDPNDDPVVDIGTLVMEFSSCNQGVVSYDTSLPGVGSGSFAVERITDLLNTQCSGGISDDTPAGVLASQQRIALVSARQGITGSGHADFEERPDRTEFKVEAEDIANGNYRIFVGGVDRGQLVVSLGRGETEFRSPVEAGKVLLTFDPRGQVVEVRDGQGAVLTSGDVVFTGGDDNGGGGGGGGGEIDFGTTDIEVELSNAGVYPAASGDAKLEPRADRTDFSVEIEDVPAGSYDLRIGGASVGTLQAALEADGTVRGELEFRDPVEPGKILLDFDPRGQQIDVLEGNTVILGTLFPGG
jgi:hypothetical protein